MCCNIYLQVPFMYTAIKQLGQNFLMDFSIVTKMVDLLDLRSGDVVLEIGPGLGILTEEVVQRLIGFDYRLYAVEIDERFVAKLSDMYAPNPNVVIVHSDILNWLPEFVPEREHKILGALPFYITSPILHNIVKMRSLPTTCVLLVQDEVGQKMADTSQNASYISVFLQTFYKVSYEFRVPRDSFDPMPNVDGAVVRMVKRPTSYSQDFIIDYERFLHEGFKFPRKMLNKVFDKEMLLEFNIDPNSRPGALTVEEWLAFYNKIKTK